MRRPQAHGLQPVGLDKLEGLGERPGPRQRRRVSPPSGNIVTTGILVNSRTASCRKQQRRSPEGFRQPGASGCAGAATNPPSLFLDRIEAPMSPRPLSPGVLLLVLLGSGPVRSQSPP